MTTAEMLRAEGRAEGEARGEARGRAEAVHAASIEQVKAWAARAVTAETLEQVFG